MSAYKWKFNSGISAKTINTQIATWTKAGEFEKIKAHEFVVSLMLRYVKHGNYDELMHVADAIGHKFTKHARTAFINWISKNSSLTYDATLTYATKFDLETKSGKESGEGGFVHIKGSKRTFEDKASIWNTDKAKHDSGRCDDNQSFWTYVQKEQAPFDFHKAVKSLLARAVSAAAKGEFDMSQAEVEFKSELLKAQTEAVKAKKQAEIEARVKAELEAEAEADAPANPA